MESKVITTKLKGKWVELIFLLWFLTLPFGAFLGSFSIGFMTIYPSLVFLGFLFVLVIPSFNKWNKTIKIFFIFLIIWFVYAILWGFWNPRNEDWKFDVKSLLMQLLYAGALFGSFYTLGANKFREGLNKGILFFTIVLILFGIFEFYTGIHLTGSFTDKLMKQTLVTKLFYSPTFIYDNTNDYLVYLLAVISIYFTLMMNDNNVDWKRISLLLLVILLATIADSRIILFVSTFLVVVQFVIYLKSKNKFFLKKEYFIGGVTILAFIFLLINSQSLFFGPKYVKGNVSSKGVYELFPTVETIEQNSESVRINLLKNGVSYMKENPFLGIGPGQFRWRHRNRQNENTVGTVINPHNFPVEIISQYGAFGWIFLIFLFFLFAQQVKKTFKSKKGFWTISLFMVYACISIVPSGFLYLNINWLIVPVLVLTTFHSLSKVELGNE